MKNKININCYQNLLIKDEDNTLITTIINLIPDIQIHIFYETKQFSIVFCWLGFCISIDNIK